MAPHHTTARTHTHRSMSALLGLATCLAMAMIGVLLLRLPAAPVTVPAPKAAVVAPNAPVISRSFADEIAGAGALDLTSAASGMQPEWDRGQHQPAVPAVVAPLPASISTNRIFADEIAGAHAAYRDPALITGPLPERMQDLPRPATRTITALPDRTRVSNRFFADEIAAGERLADWTIADAPPTISLHGPR